MEHQVITFSCINYIVSWHYSYFLQQYSAEFKTEHFDTTRQTKAHAWDKKQMSVWWSCKVFPQFCHVLNLSTGIMLFFEGMFLSIHDVADKTVTIPDDGLWQLVIRTELPHHRKIHPKPCCWYPEQFHFIDNVKQVELSLQTRHGVGSSLRTNQEISISQTQIFWHIKVNFKAKSF